MTYQMVFKNAKILDVRNQKIVEGDLAVNDGRIAGIGSFLGECEIDCTGKYISPGFIDSHVHIESSLATPKEFAKTIMPLGTTTIIADPHELVNIKGNEAMEYILNATEHLPLSVYVMLPSSVPATPFETAGADFTAEDMKQWIGHKRVLGLGEVMCYPDVLAGNPVIMEKIALCKDMIIDGHGPGLSGEDLKAYVNAGIMTDHECVSYEEAKEKCLAGLKILIREGSAARNVESIVKGLVADPTMENHLSDFMFCSDDKHLDTIEKEGHMSYNIKKGIKLGLDPLSAYSMATCNAADTYGLDHVGELASGKDADLVILDDLEEVKIADVYKKGQKVTEELFAGETYQPKDSMLHSVHLPHLTTQSIDVKVEGKTPVIGIIDGQIVTKFLEEEVPQQEGHFVPNDIYNKICVVHRHGRNDNVAAAPLKGYGIKDGAIATSVAHDSHNIIVAGDNDEDILKAIQTIEDIQGGYALVSKGKVLGTLQLDLAGILSRRSAREIEESIDQIQGKAFAMGISRDIDPFTTLSFMALPVIPELRLTDQGLVDVVRYKQL